MPAHEDRAITTFVERINRLLYHRVVSGLCRNRFRDRAFSAIDLIPGVVCGCHEGRDLTRVAKTLTPGL